MYVSKLAKLGIGIWSITDLQNLSKILVLDSQNSLFVKLSFRFEHFRQCGSSRNLLLLTHILREINFD